MEPSSGFLPGRCYTESAAIDRDVEGRWRSQGKNAPLTNGFADNRLWKRGVIYVNPDDPSWLVEKRSGSATP